MRSDDKFSHRGVEEAEDVLSADLEEEAKETLARMAPKFRQPIPSEAAASSQETMQWQRFQEERRGLLTEEVHLDKYPQETLMELQSAINEDNFADEDDEAYKERQEKEMISYLWQNFQEMSTSTATTPRKASAAQSSSLRKPISVKITKTARCEHCTLEIKAGEDCFQLSCCTEERHYTHEKCYKKFEHVVNRALNMNKCPICYTPTVDPPTSSAANKTATASSKKKQQ